MLGDFFMYVILKSITKSQCGCLVVSARSVSDWKFGTRARVSSE
jgi:hypothetical protein